MTASEIVSLVGPGPYTFVRSTDTLRGGQPSACVLCGAGICKVLTFKSSAGRAFDVGHDCAAHIPGTTRARAKAKRENKRPMLPWQRPGVHVTGPGQYVLTHTDGRSFDGDLNQQVYPATVSIKLDGVEVTKITKRGTWEELDSDLSTWLTSL